MEIKLLINGEEIVDINSIEYDELDEAIYKIKRWCHKMEDEIFYVEDDYKYNYKVDDG